jgi:enoyl-CoA hydratase/carnithine racemase
MDGREAYERGLADFIVAPDLLMTKAFQVAETLSANPDPMLRMTKDLLTRNACEQDFTAAQQRETAFLRQCWTMPEHKEAVAAFREKRPARFR